MTIGWRVMRLLDGRSSGR